MSTNWTRITLFTVAAIVVGVFELGKIARELIHGGYPTTKWDFALTALLVVSIAVVFYELKHHFHVLRQRPVLRRLATWASIITASAILALCLYGFLYPSLTGLLTILGLWIPLMVFSTLMDELGEPKNLDMFEWWAQKQRQQEQDAEIIRRREERKKFLEENPEMAAMEKWPLAAKIRSGFY